MSLTIKIFDRSSSAVTLEIPGPSYEALVELISLQLDLDIKEITRLSLGNGMVITTDDHVNRIPQGEYVIVEYEEAKEKEEEDLRRAGTFELKEKEKGDKEEIQLTASIEELKISAEIKKKAGSFAFCVFSPFRADATCS
jgi:hypothetical protein